jgi:anti-sigma B factor antagonist
MKLEISATEEGYRLAGELDMATADDLGDLLRNAKEGRHPVVLDFEGISFMDSSGLRVLLEAAIAGNGGTGVVILHPSEQVRRVLDISIPGGAPGLEVRP